MKEQKVKKMNKDTIKEGALFVHIHSNQVIRVLEPGPFPRVLPLGHDVPVYLMAEQFKYYETFIFRGGQ